MSFTKLRPNVVKSLGFVACLATSLALKAGLLQAEDRQELSLSAGGREIATYNVTRLPSPQPEAPWFGRSGFFHPVYTPRGRIVTDDFPDDHLHQHGLMFAWTSARVDGRPVDFWNSHKKQGHVEHLKTIRATADSIIVELEHVDDTAADSTVVLHERWEVTRVPHSTMNVFDLVSTQKCVTAQPLVIEEYHYGAMCVRGSAAWSRKVAMLTSGGLRRAEGNHSRTNWVAMSGQVDTAICGIAAMCHPDNFRAPQPVRIHPNAPYFCFAPMVLGSFEITAENPYVSRFRFAAFDGDPQATELDEVWQDYVAED